MELQSLDIMNAGALCRWVEAHQPEMVVHLAARTDLLGRSMDDYAANTAGVRNLIAACRAVSSVRRVIFTSSRMVCRIDHIPVDYGDYCPPNFYGRSKVEGELLVKAAEVPFEWVIVRPTSIWGPGFGIPYRNFFDQVRKGRYVHPGSHRPQKSFGFVENTVWQLEQLLLADSAKIRGRTFYLGDYEPLDIVNWADYIHQGFDLPGSIRTVPMPALWTAAKLGDVLNLVTGADRAPLTSFRLKNLITNMVYPQLSELREITGDLSVDWRQGTDRTVAWMKTET
jgi:nucleoside-diphosphate-sugar epimerase